MLILFKLNWEGVSKVLLFVKCDDVIYFVMLGNKWWKLSYVFISLLLKMIVSFGGGFFNYLYVLGFVCYKLGIFFNVVICGDYSVVFIFMIEDLKSWGICIDYVDWVIYKKWNDSVYLFYFK